MLKKFWETYLEMLALSLFSAGLGFFFAYIPEIISGMQLHPKWMMLWIILCVIFGLPAFAAWILTKYKE